jgi:integrase/recombinase XerD
VFFVKRGPRLERRISIDAFARPVLRAHKNAGDDPYYSTDQPFVATSAGGPIQDDSLDQWVRAALIEIGLAATDTSPRLLRNTGCRRHPLAGPTRGTCFPGTVEPSLCRSDSANARYITC